MSYITSREVSFLLYFLHNIHKLHVYKLHVYYMNDTAREARKGTATTIAPGIQSLMVSPTWEQGRMGGFAVGWGGKPSIFMMIFMVISRDEW